MKTPFNTNFIIDTFYLSYQLFHNGFIVLSEIPEIESIGLSISDEKNIISSQYTLYEIVDDVDSGFYGVPIGSYIILWINYQESSSSSSSSSDCGINYNKCDDLYYILMDNIGEYIQVKYIKKS